MIKFSKEQEKSIIEDYVNGMRWELMYKKYNCTSRPIYKVLKFYNIPKRPIINNETWNNEKLNKLKTMYLSNCSYKEMYKELDCKGGTLTYWVKKLKLPMRGSGKKNNYINPFLKKSPERDYWLGYLFADGHIGQGNIILTTNNIEVSNAFNKFCGNICHIYKRKYITKTNEIKFIYYPTIRSIIMCNWFMDTFNIESNKHHTLNPNIKLNWDIIRGYFDGDGSAHLKGGWIITSCSKNWIYKIKDFLTKNNIYSHVSLYKDCYKLNVYRKKELYKLVPLLYKSNTFYIDYKYKRLEPYISNNILQTE